MWKIFWNCPFKNMCMSNCLSIPSLLKSHFLSLQYVNHFFYIFLECPLPPFVKIVQVLLLWP